MYSRLITAPIASTVDCRSCAGPRSGAALKRKRRLHAAFGEALEKAGIVPFGAIAAARDADREVADDFHVFPRSGVVDRLMQIVGWRVVALRGPLARDLRLRRVRLVADPHPKRRDTAPHEACLLSA